MNERIYQCLVSRSKTRQPSIEQIAATDAGHAVFIAWCNAGHSARIPTLRKKGDQWIACDGHAEVIVTILSISQ